MVVDFKQDVLELRVKNMLKNEVRIVFNTTFLLRSKGRSLFNLFRRIPGGHDPRHSLIESISVCRRASSRERSARRRHVQEQKGQRATHLEMQGKAEEGRNPGYRGLTGAESESVQLQKPMLQEERGEKGCRIVLASAATT